MSTFKNRMRIIRVSSLVYILSFTACALSAAPLPSLYQWIPLGDWYDMICGKPQDALVLEQEKASNQHHHQEVLTPKERMLRVVEGEELIQHKLNTEREYAKQQGENQERQGFLFTPCSSLEEDLESSSEYAGHLSVGICSAQGLRPSMEDSYLATSFCLDSGEEGQLLGVFDGHAGAAASHYVASHLKATLITQLERFRNPTSHVLTPAGIWNALKHTCVSLHLQFHEEFPSDISGTTAVIALLFNKTLWIANVGDSRAILDKGLQLSEDAKPNDPRYKRDIESLNGFVIKMDTYRVNGYLAVARALGDYTPELAEAINPRPKITAWNLEEYEGSTLILGCDGLFDVTSTQELALSVRSLLIKDSKISNESLARDIVFSALVSGSTDNVTALVCRF